MLAATLSTLASSIGTSCIIRLLLATLSTTDGENRKSILLALGRSRVKTGGLRDRPCFSFLLLFMHRGGLVLGHRGGRVRALLLCAGGGTGGET